LEDIDVFWRKLNFNPSLVEEEGSDYEQQLGVVTQEILSQTSPAVKKSMVSKVMSAIFPLKSNMKAPRRQEDTRGRPNTKQQQKRDATTSVTDKLDTQGTSIQGSVVPARHSCHARTSTSQTVHRPVLQRSASSAHNNDRIPGFPLLCPQSDIFTVMQYEAFIPSIFRPFISRVTNVPPNGHCGFAAIALGLGRSAGDQHYVRQQMLAELDGPFHDWWKYWINGYVTGNFEKVRTAIDWPYPLEEAPDTHYMEFPYAGLIVAQRFGVVFHLLTVNGSQTFFPMRSGPPKDPDGNYYDHRVVSICHVNNNHFINIRLDGEYPVPPVDHYNRIWRNEDAVEWEEFYQSRIDDYIRIRERMQPRPRHTDWIDLLG
jgi:hypothetical protein